MARASKPITEARQLLNDILIRRPGGLSQILCIRKRMQTPAECISSRISGRKLPVAIDWMTVMRFFVRCRSSRVGSSGSLGVPCCGNVFPGVGRQCCAVCPPSAALFSHNRMRPFSQSDRRPGSPHQRDRADAPPPMCPGSQENLIVAWPMGAQRNRASSAGCCQASAYRDRAWQSQRACNEKRKRSSPARRSSSSAQELVLTPAHA
jgi:hypothetical protein